MNRAGDMARGEAHGIVVSARGAVDAVGGIDRRDVTVVGDGILAETVRRVLGTGSTHALGDEPAAVIDAGGTAASIALALSIVAPGGIVVLAAEPEQPCVDVRTYADVHVRGLTVTAPRAPVDDAVDVDDADVDWVLGRLASMQDRWSGPSARAP